MSETPVTVTVPVPVPTPRPSSTPSKALSVFAALTVAEQQGLIPAGLTQHLVDLVEAGSVLVAVGAAARDFAKARFGAK
jgi:uncharacterized membrane protein